MNIEEVLSTTHRISPRERVPFHCACCGECCRHVRQSVPLESLDVFRLTRLLREKDKGIICMDDFVARYTELALLDECGYFILTFQRYSIPVRRSLLLQAPPFLRLHLYGLFRHPNAFVMRNQVPTDFCSSRQDLCARLSAGYGGMKSVGNRSIVLSCL